MRFNKSQGDFLAQVIAQWRSSGTIDGETADVLMNSYSIRMFDWAKLAQYSFIIAMFCGVIATGALIADDYLLELVERVYTAPESILCFFFGLLSTIAFLLGFRKNRSHPENAFGNEAILFFGILFSALAIFFLRKVIEDEYEHLSLLLLLTTMLYGIIGFCFQSQLVWISSLLSLGCWYGVETGYLSGWSSYFFGLNYPSRFALFGAGLTGVSFLFVGVKGTYFRSATYTMGLLNLFMALWILSIFGNCGSFETWYRISNLEIIHWSGLFGLVSMIAMYFGLKHNDGAARVFGITTFLINLYTRYFEFFWSNMHKAIFFLILAISFWIIGRKAESIWSLDFFKKN